MLKLLILLPLMLVGGALALGVVLPLVALLPVLFAFGAAVLALVIAFSILGLVFRVFAGHVVALYVIASPAPPEALVGIRHHRHQRRRWRQAELLAVHLLQRARLFEPEHARQQPVDRRAVGARL